MAGRAALELMGLSRAAILACALQIAETDGVESLSMKRVATALQVSAPSVHRYFHSLADLQDALTAEALGQLVEIHREVEQKSSRRDAIEAFALAERIFAQAHPALYRLALRRPSGRDAEIDRLRQAYRDLAKNVVSDYRLPEDQQVGLASLLSAAFQGFIQNELAGWGYSTGENDRQFERLQEVTEEVLLNAEVREALSGNLREA